MQIESLAMLYPGSGWLAIDDRSAQSSAAGQAGCSGFDQTFPIFSRRDGVTFGVQPPPNGLRSRAKMAPRPVSRCAGSAPPGAPSISM